MYTMKCTVCGRVWRNSKKETSCTCGNKIAHTIGIEYSDDGIQKEVTHAIKPKGSVEKS